MGREAEFVERKTQFCDIGAPPLKVSGEPRKKATKRPHQQQHWALDSHLSHAEIPQRDKAPYRRAEQELWGPIRSFQRPQWRKILRHQFGDCEGSRNHSSNSSIACSGSMKSPLRRLT